MSRETSYDLIKWHKPGIKNSVDEIFKNQGQSVLRLPHYQPDLNPTEIISCQMKRRLTSGIMSSDSLFRLYCLFAKKVSADECLPLCEHVKGAETE
jgi:transposase